jgi:phosphatidylcholine synthase
MPDATPPDNAAPFASQHQRRRSVWGAAAVHVFTASGVVLALGATLAVIDGQYSEMFVWLAAALVVDGVDGSLARWQDVGRRLPRFSGERLDLVIDYITYVFVPALALLLSGQLSGVTGLILAAGILMSSLYHFSDQASKGDDYSFIGFPAIWNIVAFYLFAFPLPVWLVGCIVVCCIVLTFVPLAWVHPMRVKRLFVLNIAATVAGLVAAVWTLYRGFPATGWSAWVLLLAGGYLLALTVKPPRAAT